MKNVLLVLGLVALSGCVSIPQSKLSWTSGDYVVSAKRSGCEIGQFEIRNNGTKLATVFGTLDILDAQSNTVSTVQFGCDNAHPGGAATCRRSQTYNERKINEMPGYYCSGYANYKLSLRKY